MCSGPSPALGLPLLLTRLVPLETRPGWSAPPGGEGGCGLLSFPRSRCLLRGSSGCFPGGGSVTEAMFGWVSGGYEGCRLRLAASLGWAREPKSIGPWACWCLCPAGASSWLLCSLPFGSAGFSGHNHSCRPLPGWLLEAALWVGTGYGACSLADPVRPAFPKFLRLGVGGRDREGLGPTRPVGDLDSSRILASAPSSLLLLQGPLALFPCPSGQWVRGRWSTQQQFPPRILPSP